MHTMMTNVIDKYKKVINNNRMELISYKKNNNLAYQPKAQPGYSQALGF